MPNGNRIDYIIDGQNRRIGKKINGQIVKRWIYSGQLSPIAELDSIGNVVTRFVGNYMIKHGIKYRFITDHLGSIRFVIDINTGIVTQNIEYDEYGNVLRNSNPDFQPFAYAGGLYDTQTKLIRFGARDYDAISGRWTTKDPIGFSGGSTDLYSYVRNNPINYIDPTGLCKRCVGTARFSAVGPDQATGDGALAGYGISPENGTVAVNPEIFGLKMGTRKQNEKAQNTLAKDIVPNVIIMMPIGSASDGQQIYQSFTIGDIGDKNIRNSKTPRFDIYRSS
jgi:RHS repeat-associated protein